MKNSIFVRLIALLLCLLLAAGCRSNPPSAEGEESTAESIAETEQKTPRNTTGEGWALTLYADSGRLYQINEAALGFRALYPEASVEVTDLSKLSYNDFKARLAADLAAGDGPNVLYTGYSFVPNLCRLLYNGVFADMNALNDQYDLIRWEDQNQNICDFGVLGGERYFVPLTYGVGLMFSTKEKMEAAGIDYKDTDLETFFDQIRVYQKNQPDSIVLYEMPTHVDMFVRYDMFEENGQKQLFDLWNATYPDLYGNADAMKHYSIRYSLKNYDTTYDAFASGALLSIGSTVRTLTRFECLPYHAKNYSNAVENGETPVFMAYPSYKGEAPRAVIGDIAAIPSASQDKEAALAFVAYMLSLDVQIKLLQASGIPVSNAYMDYVLDYYRKEGVERGSAYYLAKFVEYAPEWLDWYENLTDNIEPMGLRDENMISIWSKALVPYLSGQSEDYAACFREAKKNLMLYENE